MGSRGHTAKVLATTLLGTLDTTALIPVIAIYAHEVVGADLLQTGIIVGLYSAVHAPANFLFGRLMDRTGRRWPLRFGLLWDALSIFLYSFATTPWLLALVRVSHGVGGGLIGPSTMSFAVDAAPPERRGRAMGYYGMVIALAFIVGTGMAVPIERGPGFEALFRILAVGLLVGLVISLTMREPRPVERRVAADWTRVAKYVRGPEPLAGYAAIFSLHFLQGTSVSLVALLIDGRFGPAFRGIGFTAFAVASMVAHYFGGRLADLQGSARPTLAGLLIAAAAIAAIPLAQSSSFLVVLMVLFGVGHGFVFPASSALVARRASPEFLGVVTGLFYAVLVIGVAVGAPVIGAVASSFGLEVAITASAIVILPTLPFVARALATSTSAAGEERVSTVR